MGIDVHITLRTGPRGSRLELAYIRFSKAPIVRTEELDADRLLAHYDKDGTLVSIEVLAPFNIVRLKHIVTRRQFTELERVLPAILLAA